MRFLLRFLTTTLLLLALAAPVFAQQPGNPGQQPGGAAAAPDTPQRNPNFEYMLAYGGMGLVLLVVCYPSRRY